MKTIKIVGIFVSFILAIILHFIYSWYPSTFLSVIAPVNESIWEHMKLIITASLIFSIFEYFIYKKRKIVVNNFIFSYAIASILSIIVYLIIYIPLDNIFGHKVYIAIGLLFLIFIFLQFISYYIINSKDISHSGEIGMLLIIIVYFVFGYFTYHPPRINLFYDYMNNGYGIIKSS